MRWSSPCWRKWSSSGCGARRWWRLTRECDWQQSTKAGLGEGTAPRPDRVFAADALPTHGCESCSEASRNITGQKRTGEEIMSHITQIQELRDRARKQITDG